MKKFTSKLLTAALFFSLSAPAVFAQDAPEYDKKQYSLLKKGKKYFKAYQDAMLKKNGELPAINLRGADLSKMDLSGINLNGADLTEAILAGSKLIKTQLEGANMQGVDLGEDAVVANLTEANLKNANLFEADLTGATLVKTNLCGANLASASLIGVNLRKANLAGSKLIETDFEQSTIDHTILVNASHEEAANLNKQYAAAYKSPIFEMDQLKSKANQFFHIDTNEGELKKKFAEIEACSCQWEEE